MISKQSLNFLLKFFPGGAEVNIKNIFRKVVMDQIVTLILSNVTSLHQISLLEHPKFFLLMSNITTVIAKVAPNDLEYKLFIFRNNSFFLFLRNIFKQLYLYILLILINFSKNIYISRYPLRNLYWSIFHHHRYLTISYQSKFFFQVNICQNSIKIYNPLINLQPKSLMNFKLFIIL